jgi:hypothetical protein
MKSGLSQNFIDSDHEFRSSHVSCVTAETFMFPGNIWAIDSAFTKTTKALFYPISYSCLSEFLG